MSFADPFGNQERSNMSVRVFEATLMANALKGIINIVGQIIPTIKKPDAMMRRHIYIKIEKTGLTFFVDPSSKIQVVFTIPSESFCTFVVVRELTISFNINILKAFFKSVRNNTRLEMRITTEREELMPSEMNFVVTGQDIPIRGFNLKFFVANTFPERPQDVCTVLHTRSQQIRALIKDMTAGSKEISVSIRENLMTFRRDYLNFADSYCSFPIEPDLSGDIDYDTVFSTESFKAISKLPNITREFHVGIGDFLLQFSGDLVCTRAKSRIIGSFVVWMQSNDAGE